MKKKIHHYNGNAVIGQAYNKGGLQVLSTQEAKRSNDRKTKMTPREVPQEEAERTFDAFITYSKRSVLWICIGLFVVVFACNNGVETGS